MWTKHLTTGRYTVYEQDGWLVAFRHGDEPQLLEDGNPEIIRRRVVKQAGVEFATKRAADCYREDRWNAEHPAPAIIGKPFTSHAARIAGCTSFTLSDGQVIVMNATHVTVAHVGDGKYTHADQLYTDFWASRKYPTDDRAEAESVVKHIGRMNVYGNGPNNMSGY